MATVIFKWNPSFSSYSKGQYLFDIIIANRSEIDYIYWDKDE
jgi:hypothetical protein